ncbi:hypothetical protein BH23CHL4_BH23CHL4_30490 [soil metagenome]
MVLPKMGASYVIKKFADEVMAEPKAMVESAIREPFEAPKLAPAPPPEKDDFDGQTISDENGEVIGTARRLRQVALYIVSDSYGELARELEQCVLDDDSRKFFVHDQQGRIAGLIYAPHPDRMPVKTNAIRADDI